MAGDLRRTKLPDLLRTLPIGERFPSRSGNDIVLISADLWSDRVVLNFAFEETVPPLMDADGRPRVGPVWSVTDDLGTRYRLLAGGAGGSTVRFGHDQFGPGVPESARWLLISSRELAAQVEVLLAP